MKTNIKGVLITRPNQELVIMRGIPGSGKSTMAKSLVREGKIHSTDDVIESQGDYDKFFADMIDKSHRYGYSWEWFADRDTLLLKAKEMYERAEWWREMKNHMSTLNKFLSPNPKK